MQFRILPDVFVSNELQRVSLRNSRRDFSHVAAFRASGSDFQLRVTRHVKGVILFESKAPALSFDVCPAFQADKSRLLIIVCETYRLIVGSKGDAPVVQ